MSDLGKYLPLSQRRSADESRVTSNWSRPLGTIVVQIADLLDEMPPERLAEPSMRPGWSIGDVARQLSWRLGTSPAVRARMLASVAFARRMTARRAALELGRESVHTADVATRLRAIAVSAMTAGARSSITDLSEAVVAAYDIVLATGVPLEIDPVASGAVAIARSLTAPLEIRAVLRDKTIVATDADWRIGHGPELPGSAAGIILFLFGRQGLPTGPSHSTPNS